jgi:hypothetical protein
MLDRVVGAAANKGAAHKSVPDDHGVSRKDSEFSELCERSKVRFPLPNLSAKQRFSKRNSDYHLQPLFAQTPTPLRTPFPLLLGKSGSYRLYSVSGEAQE